MKAPWLQPIYDRAGNLIGAIAPNGKPAYFASGPVVVSSTAPSNNDGRPDGTVYVQAP